jgi:phage replication-related protein YjqB (UPF0714/DUF867 family)
MAETAMADEYRDFDALRLNENPRSFRIRQRKHSNAPAIVAPHGGGIEAGTSEVADAVAGGDCSFYAFEGIKARRNGTLHITSTRFDEPQCRALLAKASSVIAIHGEASPTRKVFLGGRDMSARHRVREALEAHGFAVRTHGSPRLQGTEPRNLCNRGSSGRGVQLELSKGLRRSFFRSLSRTGRRTKTEQFWVFVNALRAALGDD